MVTFCMGSIGPFAMGEPCMDSDGSHMFCTDMHGYMELWDSYRLPINIIHSL